MAKSKRYVPTEPFHRCEIRTHLGLSDGGEAVKAGCDGRPMISRWIATETQRASVSMSLALQQPFKSLQSPPVVQLAARISQLHQHRGRNSNSNIIDLKDGPTSGLVFCGAGSLGTLGLPFHIEGPFIQDLNSTRDCLCLPLTPSESHTTDDLASLQTTQSESTPLLAPIFVHQSADWNAALLSDALKTLVPKLLVEITCVKDFVMGTAGDRSRFYQFWPFLPRMSLRGAQIARTCKMLEILSTTLFEERKFVTQADCLLITSSMSSQVLQYLEDLLPIAVTPVQVGKDLMSHPSGQTLGMKTLSPAVLRKILGKDPVGHCKKLQGKPELLIPMLRFYVSDAPRPEESTSKLRRRYFCDLAGCPLLPTSDGMVRSFSLHPKDRVAIATPALQVLLPQLASSFFDPKYLPGLASISNNVELREVLYVHKISAIYLQASQIFHSSLRNLSAVLWSGAGFISDAVSNVDLTPPIGTSLSNVTTLPEAVRPSAMLVFALWKDVLSVTEMDIDEFETDKKRNENQLQLLEDWPLLPVVSLGRKLLMSPFYLSHVLALEHESDPSIDYGDRVETSSDVAAGDHPNYLETDKSWEWKSQISKECADLAPKAATIAPCEVTQAVDDNNTPPLSPSPASIPRRTVFRKQRNPDFFTAHPNQAPSLVLHGQRILTCLLKLHHGSGMPIHRPLSLPLDTSHEASCKNGNDVMLSFDTLSLEKRNAILVNVAQDLSHQPLQLRSQLGSQLRSLPLFTSTNGCVVTADALGGTFWCKAEEVIEKFITALHHADVNHTSSSGPGPAPLPVPMLLQDDSHLRDVVYPLVGVTQLTYLEGVPHNYESGVESKTKTDRLRQLSRARDVLSWEKETLLQALRCTARTRSCNTYFPPPQFRNDGWHAFLKDLGMQDDLNNDSLLRVSRDIEVGLANKHHLSREEQEIVRVEAACRARGLLGYLQREEGRDAAISALSDRNTAEKIAKLSFVPARIPVRVDAGGVLVISENFTSFDKMLSDGARILGFTVMPVLNPELEPTQSDSGAPEPQQHHNRGTIGSIERRCIQLSSATYICCDIIHSTRPLGRHSSCRTAEIEEIEHCSHWSQSHQTWPSFLPSPFMHEVQRCFGSCECILKQLGVRESPSRADYRMFLQEQKRESRDQSLNSNELRAVFTIVQVYSTPFSLSSYLYLFLAFLSGDTENEDIGHTHTSDILYVPDDRALLRDPMQCLMNDDDWLQDQCAEHLSSIGMYFIHSSLSTSVATALKISFLSDVIHKTIVSPSADRLQDDNNNDNELQNSCSNRFRCPLFTSTVFSLLSKFTASNKVSGVKETSSSLHSRVQQCLETVTIRFSPELFTQLQVIDPRRRRRPSSSSLKDDQDDHPSSSVLQSECNACLSFTMTSNSYSYSSTTGGNDVILINRSMLTTPLTVSLAVARGLATLLQMPMQLAPTLVLLLDATPALSVDLLHSLHLGGIRSKDGVDNWYRDVMRGVPGQSLTEEDKRLLELNPFRSFRPTEIVATATAVETSLEDERGDGHGQMIYGVVMHCSEDGETGGGGGAGLRRVSAMQGKGRVVKLISSDIYSFRSVRKLVLRSASTAAPPLPPTDRSTASTLALGVTVDRKTLIRSATAATPTPSTAQGTVSSDDIAGLGP
eukprot:gene3781-7507_t